MGSIKLLPSSTVDKIAAGEVVERPASVVKELLENAVDSGATRIDVAIEKGGIDLVRVVDNGRGIPADELPLAVTNHATSKIESAEDLFRVGSLGFRGEALASIAAVSRVTIRSRPEGAEGAEIRVEGAGPSAVEPAGCPTGTTVEARELFYNTPVRRKFLRTPQTEAAHATEALARVALANPAIHFTLSHNGRTVHDLPPCGESLDGWRGRITALFGDELAAALIPVKSDDPFEESSDGDGVTLEGLVASPTVSRSHNKMQYLLVNGRAVRDRSLQHALGEAYRGLLLTGRKPVAFVRIAMPSQMVDVNVHPQKQEVRFADSGRVYSQLLGTLRSKFLSSDLRAGAPRTEPETDDASHDGKSELAEWAKSGLTQRRFDAPTNDPASGSDGVAPFQPFPSTGEPLTLHRFVREATGDGATDGRSTAPTAAVSAAAAPTAIEDDPARTDAAHTSSATRKAIQLHDCYLVVETEAGMEVIDQHALHERVLYEQLRARVLERPLERQRLLTPEPVDLAPAEAAAVLEQSELLGRLGLEVSPFGGDTVLVGSTPSLLSGRVAPAAILREVASKLIGEGSAPEARDLCDDLLHTMSCKAAVKYGDPLTEEEISALLAARPATENHHHCPHGRPTSLIFTREELDRRFQR